MLLVNSSTNSGTPSVRSTIWETTSSGNILPPGRDWNPLIHIPAGYMKLLDHPTLTWGFHAESDSGTAGRAIAYPRGRVLGGSSSINGMIYVRGHPEDFDYWAQLGNRGWSWDDVLPFFRKAENWEGEADAVHGKGVERSRLIPGCQCLIRGSALCVTQRTTRIRSSRNPPPPARGGEAVCSTSVYGRSLFIQKGFEVKRFCVAQRRAGRPSRNGRA
jgi:choline dehydrogenase-like flavoprotein